jgi:hypothetical protein
MHSFKETVQQSWEKPIHSQNKARVLHIKLSRLAKVQSATQLSRLAKALKQWSKSKLAMIKQESAEAAQLVLQLDQQQDSRQLTDEEIRQRKIAKSMILGLAAVRKIKLR